MQGYDFAFTYIAIPADAYLLNGYAPNGYALNGYVLVGCILNGYVLKRCVLTGYVLNGYVWDDAYRYAWCDIRQQSSEEPCDETSFGKNENRLNMTLRIKLLGFSAHFKIPRCLRPTCLRDLNVFQPVRRHLWHLCSCKVCKLSGLFGFDDAPASRNASRSGATRARKPL